MCRPPALIRRVEEMGKNVCDVRGMCATTHGCEFVRRNREKCSAQTERLSPLHDHHSVKCVRTSRAEFCSFYFKIISIWCILKLQLARLVVVISIHLQTALYSLWIFSLSSFCAIKFESSTNSNG